MGSSKDRPGISPVAVDPNQSIDVLKRLLAVELERLECAVAMEKARHIVFPETTIIIRDIQKLTFAINGKPGKSLPGEMDMTDDEWPDI